MYHSATATFATRRCIATTSTILTSFILSLQLFDFTFIHCFLFLYIKNNVNGNSPMCKNELKIYLPFAIFYLWNYDTTLCLRNKIDSRYFHLFWQRSQSGIWYFSLSWIIILYPLIPLSYLIDLFYCLPRIVSHQVHSMLLPLRTMSLDVQMFLIL